MAWPCRLLALDLDGTLLKDDGEIAHDDRLALERARARGIHVTIATGRLVGGAVPVARELGLTLPLICADGSATACPRTATFLEAATIAPSALERVFSTISALELAPFLLTPDSIFSDPAGRALEFLEHWGASIFSRRDLIDAALTPPALPAILILAFGKQEQVRGAVRALDTARDEALQTSTFSVADTGYWALRVSAVGTSKAAGLARLAASLGVLRSEVAAVGDWFNDVSMFRWAGQSYAMGQAPEAVASAAKRRLTATSATGGGIAEAIDHLLESTPTRVGFADTNDDRGIPLFPDGEKNAGAPLAP